MPGSKGSKESSGYSSIKSLSSAAACKVRGAAKKIIKNVISAAKSVVQGESQTSKNRLRSGVYQFFKLPELLKNNIGREYQYFKCATPKGCKIKGKGTSGYQTNKDGTKASDRASTSNLMKHATKCWGADIVSARLKGVEVQGKDGSIFSAFARATEHPIAPSDHTLTEAELKSHIIRWVAENNQPLSIVEDHEFKYILRAGQPEFCLLGCCTVACDLNGAYKHSHTYVQKLLEEYPGQLSFGTDMWTSPNHWAFVAWTVHLQHEGELLSFLLLKDMLHVLKVFKDATFYFSNENHCTITQVLTTMDKIDDLITATVITSSLQPGGAPKHALHSSIKSALKLTKSTLNKYYSRTDDSNIYRIAMILHPNYKLEYFLAWKWEKAWIKTAESLIREEFEANYDSTANGDQGTDGASDGEAVCFHMP
ncbi:Dimer-Tnp-hAT domain-containing protein [Mycena venus]|uniref:Dimer-Tnp-hAT domain-containing protein n=1 Tax=Mycena venus TaxID=2733690 RepID=A0A8H6X8U6_9AGAR|nr:Dimer-Tnp-hAT domain-containing protein [Mycena venus]